MSAQPVVPNPESATPVSDGRLAPNEVRGALPSDPSANDRCTHLRNDGKRCASRTYPGHDSLCHYHLSRQIRGISDGDLLAADILNSIGNFQSATAINLVLGKIFVHQITGRLSRQDALALCYNCQLLLQTLPAVKQELVDGGFAEAWKGETARILSSDPDLCHQTNRSLLPTGPGLLKPASMAPSSKSPKPFRHSEAAKND